MPAARPRPPAPAARLAPPRPAASLDPLADQLDAAILARDFYAARAFASLLVALTAGRPDPRVSVLLMRAPPLPCGDLRTEAGDEAAWLDSLPHRRKCGV